VINTNTFAEAEPMPPGWAWDEFNQTYASRAAAVSLNQNLVGVGIAPAGTGEPVRVSFPLGLDAFRVVNESTTVRAGAAPTLVVERALDGNSLVLRGNYPASGGKVSRAVPAGRPVDLAGQLLLRALEKEGIAVDGKVRVTRLRGMEGVTLAAVQGAPIADLIRECNEDSNNFLAESLYLISTAKLYGTASYGRAHDAEEQMWKRLKVDMSEVRPADGSGLSRENHITPHAFVELLQDRADVDWFVESLPQSGVSGTLRHRLGGGMARRVRAKTGTLDGVAALSGYVTANSGRTIYFSIMANNYTTSASPIRAKIDDIVELLAQR